MCDVFPSPTIINIALEKAASSGDSMLLFKWEPQEFTPAFNTNPPCKFAEGEYHFSEVMIGIHLMGEAKRKEIIQLVLPLRVM